LALAPYDREPMTDEPLYPEELETLEGYKQYIAAIQRAVALE
jgi:hypothetical protein